MFRNLPGNSPYTLYKWMIEVFNRGGALFLRNEGLQSIEMASISDCLLPRAWRVESSIRMEIGRRINLGSSNIKSMSAESLSWPRWSLYFLALGLRQENSSSIVNTPANSSSSSRESGSLKKSLLSSSTPACVSAAPAFLQVVQRAQ